MIIGKLVVVMKQMMMVVMIMIVVVLMMMVVVIFMMTIELSSNLARLTFYSSVRWRESLRNRSIKIAIWNSPAITNADLKISVYVWVHIKIIPWKFCVLTPKIFPVIYLWSLKTSLFLTYSLVAVCLSQGN